MLYVMGAGDRERVRR